MKPFLITSLTISTLITSLLISESGVSGARILFLLPIASHSQQAVFEPLIKAIALSDHDVTVVSPAPVRSIPKSVKEIHPATVEELGYGPTFGGKDLLESRKELKMTNHFLPIFWNFTLVDLGCHRLYTDVQIKYLMNGFKKFDLAIVSGIQNECALGLVYHFRIPHIYLTTSAAPNYVVSRFGHYFPTSFVPSPYTVFDDSMTFTERCVNFIVETMLVAFAKFYLYPHYEELYREYVGEDALGIDEIDDNVGVVLMNSHFVTSYPRPVMPNLIEIGGMHCRLPRPLPTELDRFLDEPEEGFIYFSLGSLVKAEDIPEQLLNIFLKVFSRLDQRVIWKYDKDIPKKPDNVMIGHWLPQQDILGHRNIMLFISNGGLLSTQEAIYHGVPILGIPLTGEHDQNMKQAELDGFALSWEILSLNETWLEDLIDTLIIQPQYKARAKYLSKLYRDIPDNAIEKALFWVEYVLRNKGAPQLRSPSKDLNFFQYHSIDVIAFLIFLLLFTIYAIFTVISLICCRAKKSQSEADLIDARNGVHKNKYD